jgi:hypothetical protein
MADVENQPPVRKPKQAESEKPAYVHPKYDAMMVESAIRDLNDRKGTSRIAVTTYISSKYNVPSDKKRVTASINKAMHEMLNTNRISHVGDGIGLIGKFRLGAKGPVKKKVERKPKVAKSTTQKAMLTSDDENSAYAVVESDDSENEAGPSPAKKGKGE